jgi:hypothetical protein
MSKISSLAELLQSKRSLCKGDEIKNLYSFLLRGHVNLCDLQSLPKRFTSLPLFVVSGSLATFLYAHNWFWGPV